MPLDNESVARKYRQKKSQTAEPQVCFHQKLYTYIYKVYQQNAKPPKVRPTNATLCIKSKNGKKRIREGQTDLTYTKKSGSFAI